MGGWVRIVETTLTRRLLDEHKDNLLATEWVPDTNLLGNGLILPLSFPTTNSPQRFYRVRSQ